jgi:hypothetical protein
MKFRKRNQVAAISAREMETGDHSNGVDLKSRMSRGNNLIVC